MKHYLNVCDINGAEIEPVDVITFGSPCQDMSVAGKREGIKHSDQGDEETTRSGLFYEAVRIIKEMRDATNGEYPKYAVWENVPGAFSSNKGHDFHAVLEALCSVKDDTVSIPRPCDKRNPDKLAWNGAGEIVGDNYSIAWRTLDAQYWGVPQRRKRIYLVADFTGGRAGEILFKPDSLRGDLPQGNEAGQGITADAVGGVDGSVGVGINGNVAGTLDANYFKGCGLRQGVEREVVAYSFDSLSSNSMKSSNPSSGCRAVEVAKCIDTTYPDPSKNQGGVAVVQPVIALQANGIDRADTADRHAVCYPLNEQIILRHGALGKNTGFGAGDDGDPAYTLQANHPHAVCYDARNHNAQDISGTIQAKSNGGQSLNYINPVCYDARGNGDGETVPTLTGDHQNRITDYTAVAVQAAICGVTSGVQFTGDFDTTAKTLRARDFKEPQAVVAKTNRRYIIRRLTPTECARLQGFPDNWGQLAPYDPADADFWEDVRKTHAEINGKTYKPVKDIKKWYDKLHTDGAEYKAYGNGLALPNAEFVMRGIAEMLRNEKGQFESKGGVIEHNGYVCVYKPEHPRARANGYVRKHILVAEEMLNRPLNSEEVVHHINGDKTDNRPENLEVFATHAEHVKHHNHKDGKKYSYKGSEYTVAELSEFSVVDYSVLTQRINKLGWDIERAVETPKRGQPTLGSLFDGIGGFPLAGVLNGIEPLWSSEVEPYPIAVTVSRFGIESAPTEAATTVRAEQNTLPPFYT